MSGSPWTHYSSLITHHWRYGAITAAARQRPLAGRGARAVRAGLRAGVWPARRGEPRARRHLYVGRLLRLRLCHTPGPAAVDRGAAGDGRRRVVGRGARSAGLQAAAEPHRGRVGAVGWFPDVTAGTRRAVGTEPEAGASGRWRTGDAGRDRAGLSRRASPAAAPVAV